MDLSEELKKILFDAGASLVGFADIRNLYAECLLDEPRSEDSVTEMIHIPEYPYGVSIALAVPPQIITQISEGPTRDYFNSYHDMNNCLDNLAELCSTYISDKGFHAYAQTVNKTKEFGIFRTVMPHKTVAIHSGLGWIGKSALLVTPQYGTAIRLTSVLTDAPLRVDKPSEKSLCGGCMKCHDACPANAISGDLWYPDTDRDNFFDAMACRKKAREIAAATLNEKITLCGKCIEICPYTQKYILNR